MFDLLLHGGDVIDGTGGPRVRADVAVQHGRLVAVRPGLAAQPAREKLDVQGRVVAPGFIDVHNHSDGWLLKTPHFTPKTAQGFTTEILMSDGISYAPLTPELAPQWICYLRSLNGLLQSDYCGWRSLADYLQLLSGRTVQNVAGQIPLANLRVLAAGWANRPLDDTQIKIVRGLVEECLAAGTLALSTGLDYITQGASSTAELAEICAALAPARGFYVTHVRYKKGLLPAIREAVEIGRRAGVGVHISHLKASSQAELDELLDYIDRVASREVEFTFDIYPYSAGSTMLNFLLPYEVWEDGPLACPPQLVRPEVRARFARLLPTFFADPEAIRIAWTPGKELRHVQGQTLTAFAAERGLSVTEALLELLLEEHLAALAVVHGGDERFLHPLLAHPLAMIGSDGIYFPEGQIHPRMYGTAPKVLGPLVREQRLFNLETAVSLLTGRPARRFGLGDRGRVHEGCAADLVVFDPATVCDRATYDNPREPPVGVTDVFVNGVRVIADSRPAAELPGPLPGRWLKCAANG